MNRRYFLIGMMLAALVGVGAAAAWLPAQMNGTAGGEVVTRAQSRVATFFEALAATPTAPEKPFADLLEGSPLAAKKTAVDALIAKMRELESRYGKSHGYEPVDSQRIGQDVLVLKYLVKCENYPLVWSFVLYRDQRAAAPATAAWQVVSVRYDTDIEMLAL